MLYQLFIMFGTALLGQVISGLLPFPFPSTIIAALILFLLLEFKIVRLDALDDVVRLSNKYLAIVFIPVGVAVMEYFSEFPLSVWLKISLIIILSTAATMMVTGKVSDMIIAIQDKVLGGKKNA